MGLLAGFQSVRYTHALTSFSCFWANKSGKSFKLGTPVLGTSNKIILTEEGHRGVMKVPVPVSLSPVLHFKPFEVSRH